MSIFDDLRRYSTGAAPLIGDEGALDWRDTLMAAANELERLQRIEREEETEEQSTMRLASALTAAHPPCPLCHMPLRYDAGSAVYLHEREQIDQFDNGYQCAAEYEPVRQYRVECPKCGHENLLWAREPILGQWAICMQCAHQLKNEVPELFEPD